MSIRYTERVAEAGIEPSVGSVKDSYDNALAWTIIGLYKTEVIRQQGPWRGIDPVELTHNPKSPEFPGRFRMLVSFEEAQALHVADRDRLSAALHALKEKDPRTKAGS